MATASAAFILDSLAGEDDTEAESSAPQSVSNAPGFDSPWRDEAPQVDDDLENDDPSLNSDELFSDRNFKSGTSGLNERGRGAFAAAALCLLEMLDNTSGHIHVARAANDELVERWQLNRMPGRTDACLRFVNLILISMLGVKAFPTWRSLARSLGALSSLCTHANCALACLL